MELAAAHKAHAIGKPGARPGGRILADALVAQGIDHVFAVPGESYLDVLDGLYAVRQKVHLITCRFAAAGKESGRSRIAPRWGGCRRCSPARAGRSPYSAVRVGRPRGAPRSAACWLATRCRSP